MNQPICQDLVRAARGVSKICMESSCQKNFEFMRKEHICKRCLKPVCSQCSQEKLIIAYYDYQPKDKHRVCKTCFLENKFQRKFIEDNKLSIGRTSQIALKYLVSLNIIDKVENQNEIKQIEQTYEKSPSKDIGQRIQFQYFKKSLSYSFRDFIFCIQGSEDNNDIISMKLTRLLGKLMASFGWEKIPNKFIQIALFFLTIGSEGVAFYIISEIYNKLLPKYIVELLTNETISQEKIQWFIQQLQATCRYSETEEKNVLNFILTIGLNFLSCLFVDMISFECFFFVINEFLTKKDFSEVENFLIKLTRYHQQFISKNSYNTEYLKNQALLLIFRNTSPNDFREITKSQYEVVSPSSRLSTSQQLTQIFHKNVNVFLLNWFNSVSSRVLTNQRSQEEQESKGDPKAEEQRKQKELEEQQRRTAAEEQQRRAAAEEQQRRAAEEQQRRAAEEQQRIQAETTLKNEMRQSIKLLGEKEQELNETNTELKSLRIELTKSKEIQVQRDLLLTEVNKKEELIINFKRQISELQAQKAQNQHPHNNQALDKLWEQLQQQQLLQATMQEDKRQQEIRFQSEKDTLTLNFTQQLNQSRVEIEEMNVTLKQNGEFLGSSRLNTSENEKKSRYDEIKELRRLLEEQVQSRAQRELELKDSKQTAETRLQVQKEALESSMTQVIELKQNLDQMSRSQAQLISEHKTLMELTISNNSLAFEDLQLQITELEATIAQLKQLLDQANVREKKQNIEIDSMNQHIIIFQKELNKSKETEQKLSETEKQLSVIQITLKERDNSIENLKAKLDSLQSQYSQDIQSLQQKLQLEKEEKLANEKLHLETAKQLEIIRKEKASAEQSWAEERELVRISEENFKGEIVILRNNLQQSIEKSSQLDQSWIAMKKESEARRLRINELEVEIVNLKQQINHMQIETQSTDEIKISFESKLQEKEEIIIKNNANIEELQEIIRKLRAELEATSKKLLEAQAEFQKFRNIVVSVKQNINDMDH